MLRRMAQMQNACLHSPGGHRRSEYCSHVTRPVCLISSASLEANRKMIDIERLISLLRLVGDLHATVL